MNGMKVSVGGLNLSRTHTPIRVDCNGIPIANRLLLLNPIKRGFFFSWVATKMVRVIVPFITVNLIFLEKSFQNAEDGNSFALRLVRLLDCKSQHRCFQAHESVVSLTKKGTQYA